MNRFSGPGPFWREVARRIDADDVAFLGFLEGNSESQRDLALCYQREGVDSHQTLLWMNAKRHQYLDEHPEVELRLCCFSMESRPSCVALVVGTEGEYLKVSLYRVDRQKPTAVDWMAQGVEFVFDPDDAFRPLSGGSG